MIKIWKHFWFKKWKKYSISLLSRLLLILDIEIFPFIFLILLTYSDDEKVEPWSECRIKLFLNLVFKILFNTNSISSFNDISYVRNLVYDHNCR
ncbi:hypothetical protein NW069_02660 [Mycoplasmopsis cynos]|uniref:hypothetical protein n=1 Tax=Mycoplasmopsis cynos TaxID=171284 RepID=UPI002204C2C5|nr:hypothetical protein [Mycoplasmopsis cynos]UWV80247.1 hypothetical protein NW069_02660 [Mycoplasmopsis cynos]